MGKTNALVEPSAMQFDILFEIRNNLIAGFCFKLKLIIRMKVSDSKIVEFDVRV